MSNFASPNATWATKYRSDAKTAEEYRKVLLQTFSSGFKHGSIGEPSQEFIYQPSSPSCPSAKLNPLPKNDRGLEPDWYSHCQSSYRVSGWLRYSAMSSRAIMPRFDCRFSYPDTSSSTHLSRPYNPCNLSFQALKFSVAFDEAAKERTFSFWNLDSNLCDVWCLVFHGNQNRAITHGTVRSKKRQVVLEMRNRNPKVCLHFVLPLLSKWLALVTNDWEMRQVRGAKASCADKNIKRVEFANASKLFSAHYNQLNHLT